MTADLTVFDYEGARVRVVTGDDGEPLFVASDVARILAYRKASDMVRVLDDDERGAQTVRTPGGPQETTVVSEAGLYHLVLRRESGYVSDPAARAGIHRFQRWVTHEVLPAVRRHGVYATRDAVEAMLADPDSMIRVLTALREERASRRAAEQRGAELEERLEAEAPHARFGRLVSSCEGDLLVGQVAALITQGGLPVTQVQLFAWLRGHGWLCRGSDRMWNMPTKWALTRRYMRFAVTVVATGHGTRERTTPYVTGPGQQVLTDGFLTGRYALTGGGGSS